MNQAREVRRDRQGRDASGKASWRNAGETVAFYAASRMSQLRKSSSAASQLSRTISDSDARPVVPSPILRGTFSGTGSWVELENLGNLKNSAENRDQQPSGNSPDRIMVCCRQWKSDTSRFLADAVGCQDETDLGWMPMSRRRPEPSSKRAGPRRLSKRRLDHLVEEAIIDAYGESEQRIGLLTIIQENLACPFTTEVLGIPVRVERVDLNGADEIVAVCRRQRQRQLIPILDLPQPSPPAGWDWIDAYRLWAREGR